MPGSSKESKPQELRISITCQQTPNFNTIDFVKP